MVASVASVAWPSETGHGRWPSVSTDDGLVSASHAMRQLTTHTVLPGHGTLQAAIDAASAGDVLVLADGTYTGSYNTHIMLRIGKSITIRALNPGMAILDGENARRVVEIVNAGTVVLDGLHITRGFCNSCVRAHTPAPPHPHRPDEASRVLTFAPRPSPCAGCTRLYPTQPPPAPRPSAQPASADVPLSPRPSLSSCRGVVFTSTTETSRSPARASTPTLPPPMCATRPRRPHAAPRPDERTHACSPPRRPSPLAPLPRGAGRWALHLLGHRAHVHRCGVQQHGSHGGAQRLDSQ